MVRRVVTEGDVLQVERSLYRIRQDLISKQEELRRFAPASSEGTGWMGRMFGGSANSGMWFSISWKVIWQ